MKTLAFEKWQALGNDFVLIDACEHPAKLDAALIVKMADRKRGIGFDQLLLIEAGKHVSDVLVKIYNADGSAALQCGNGLRCVARYLQERNASPEKISIRVAGRTATAYTLPDKSVQIDFGQARYLGKRSFYESDYDCIELGNQHAVIFLPYLPSASDDQRAEMLQNSLENSINVVLCFYESPAHLICRIIERGAGHTLACGSGAAAAVVAAKAHYALADEVTVSQAGGDLKIRCDEQLNLIQIGEAQPVFKGEYFLMQ